jgi:tight adherence protein B
MTFVLPVLLSIGLILILDVAIRPDRPGTRSWPWVDRRVQRLRDELVHAGLPTVTPTRLLVACVATGSVAAAVAATSSRTGTIAITFGLLAGWTPWGFVRHRAGRRRQDLREVWPDAVDTLTSAVRAGMSLPEALAALAERGPDDLRPAFRAFAADYRGGGRFDDSLDRLKARLADPVGDRLIESLRVARQVGGHDLGRVLRMLSAFLRDDLRTRGELRSRQSWTVNSARLAVAAPWVLLAVLALRPEAVAAYDSRSGALVLMAGGAVCFVAYRVMTGVGRLPDEPRVLR